MVITRHWTGKELTEAQRMKASGKEEQHVKTDTSEIFYLPYPGSLRDRVFVLGEKHKIFSMLSKLLTAIYLVLQNFFISFIPCHNFYYKAKKLLNEQKDIEYLIISGNLFEQFFFGYLLKKEFPHIKWVADYRDEWTTSEIIDFTGLKKWLWKMQSYSEKKWVGKADLITANTQYAQRKLGQFHSKNTELLLNGFEVQKPASQPIPKYNKLTILHNGTLYPTQDISLLKEALNEMVVPENFCLELSFPGVKHFKLVADKIEEDFKGLPVKLHLSERIPQAELMKLQCDADVMLMVAHKGKKGIVGSKLYEYIGLHKTVLLCPTDYDELESTLKETGLGIIVEDKEALKKELYHLIAMKQKNGVILSTPNEVAIEKLSREAQVKQLSKYLNHL
jgi:hypothetical protein